MNSEKRLKQKRIQIETTCGAVLMGSSCICCSVLCAAVIFLFVTIKRPALPLPEDEKQQAGVEVTANGRFSGYCLKTIDGVDYEDRVEDVTLLGLDGKVCLIYGDDQVITRKTIEEVQKESLEAETHESKGDANEGHSN